MEARRPHDPMGDHRLRDLLPLPLFEPDAYRDLHQKPKRTGLSEGAYRRQVRRFENVTRANCAISAINRLGGFKAEKQGAPTEAQRASMDHILSTLVKRPRPNSVFPQREAIRELLHYRPSSYDCEESEPVSTTVRPYQRSLVSLPEPGSTVNDALDLLDEVGRDTVLAFHDTMLRDFEKEPPKQMPGNITPYMDVNLKSSEELYSNFVADLWERNMLDFEAEVKSLVTPFFVTKKSGKLRMVLDCRVSNTFFKDPPDIAMPAGYSFSQLELGPNENMFVAQTDIRDYFYSIGLPKFLRSFFGLPRVNLRKVAPSHPLCQDGLFTPVWRYPVMRVVPMGFSWAMYIAQRVHQHQSMIAANIPMTQVLVDGRPSPPLTQGVILVPYADNLNIIGCKEHEVREVKERVTSHLSSLGFRIHEEQEPLLTAESSGFYLDGKVGRIYPKPNKLQKVRQVLLWLASQPRVSGKMIERIVGHCIHFCMLRGELLSIFRAVYDFKQVSYNKRTKLWSTAAQEFWCMAHLLDFCFADLRRPWSKVVTASDASLTGTAVCAANWNLQEVQQAGRQREVWRFRAVGSAGRAREHVQSLDPFVDAETVKPQNSGVDGFQLNLEFAEIDPTLLLPEKWTTQFAAKMDLPEHITLLEGRGIVQALRHKARSVQNYHQRHVHLNDNLGMTLSFDRGRAKNKALLFQCRRVAALAIATNTEHHFRWIPSELNIADKPSRLFERERHASKRSQKKWRDSVLYSKEGLSKTEQMCKTKFGDQPIEKDSSPIRWSGPSQIRCFDQKGNLRPLRRDADPEKKEVNARARCHSSPFATDFSGAISNFSKDSCRLSSPSGSFPQLLCAAAVGHDATGGFGQSIDHFSPAVLQRRNGVGRSNQIPGRHFRLEAGSSTQGCTPSLKEVTARMEEFRSRPLKATTAVALDRTDCSRNGFGRADPKCHVGSDHVCNVLPANRYHEADQERSPSLIDHEAILDSHPQQIREHGALEGRYGRRIHALGFKDNSLVGPCSGSHEPQLFSTTASVSGRVWNFPACLEESVRKDRPASKSSSSLPAAPLWRQLGQIQTVSKPIRSKGSRQMEFRFFNGQVRKTRAFDATIRSPAACHPNQVYDCNKVFAKAGPKKFEPSKPVKGQPTWCLELFSGPSRLAKTLARHGFHVEAWDAKFGASCDLSCNQTVNALIDRIKAGKIFYVHISVPYGTWSRSRRDDKVGPSPLRNDRQFLKGLPNLSNADKAKVNLENVLTRHAVRIVRACQQSHVLWSLANPVTSRLWLARSIKQLQHAAFLRADFCQYGLPWKKSHLFLCDERLAFDFHTCSGSLGWCSASPKPHLSLHRNTRKGLTKFAQAYPWQLCHCMSKHLALLASKQYK